MPTMTTSSTAAALEEKLRNVLMQDDNGQGPISRCGERPSWADDGRSLSETEMDLRGWGVVYGMAFAIARMDDPFESTGQVAERALPAAWGAYQEWGADIARPNRDERIMKLRRAVEGEWNASKTGGADMTRDIAGAIQDVLYGEGS